jgi:hypothetical protein
LLRKWVNTDPEKFFIDYEAASGWVPGVVRIRGLTVRGSDSNVQWHARMERATLSISLLDLMRKEFHARQVRAEGLVFRLRQKVGKAEISQAHEKRLPEIPGFSSPPWKVAEPEPRPLTPKEKRRFWTIRIDDLAADPVPEIWIEIYRFRGHARVTGGFGLRPHHYASIGPAAVEFVTGRFELAPSEIILASASGRADCTFDTFSPDEVRGQAIWPKISGAIRLEGRPEDLRFLNHFLRHSPEPRLSGGGGKVRFETKFDHGIGKGSGDFSFSRADFRYSDGTVSGRATGRIAIPRWDAEHGNMEISGSRVELAGVTRSGTSHDERDWWGRFDFPSGRFHDGLNTQVSVSCRDARPLYTLFNATLPGWAEGILKLEGMTAKARVRLAPQLVDVENLDAAGGKFHIAGRYREKKDDRQGAFLVETGILAVGVAIEGKTSHVKLLGARKWFEEETASKQTGLRPPGPQARLTSTTTAVP